MSYNAGNGVIAVTGPGSATLDLMRDVFAGNSGDGINSNQTSGGIAQITVGNSLISNNNLAVQSVGGGALLSYQTNQLTGNASNGNFTGSTNLH
jgi:hypothetical protein